MLASVEPLSRPPVGFQLLKMDGPNGELEPGMWAKGLRCGMEPALRRDNNVEAPEDGSDGSSPGDGDLKGLCEGAGLEDLEARVGMLSNPFPAPPGENLEGTVPALARRPVDGRLSGVGS